jgi:LmbE family N-acetylglucosaminyl deacetylase
MWETFFEVLKVAILIAPIVTYVKAIWSKYTMHLFQRTLKKHNILYVIAHPDDEAMFFVPSIMELRKHNNLFLLCLSTGNSEGLGKIREKELHESAKYLGFTSCHVVDDPNLQDG